MISGEEIFPGIVVYDNAIQNSEELISLALSQSGWKDSEIGNENPYGTVNKDVRNARVLNIPASYANDPNWYFVERTIWNYGDHYGKQFNISFSGIEPLQFLHYTSGEGFHLAHSDMGPGIQRIFSAVLYLNDVEDGGETFFDRFNISIKPKKGRLILFPSDYAFSHEARRPVSGDKFAIVTWFIPIT